MKTKFSLILTLCLVLVAQITFAQQKSISGTVSDESGVPLAGVNVLVKGTTTGTQTDFDGKYSINAKAGDIISFTYLGLTSQEMTVGASNTIDVTMAEDASILDEVVVVAYGTASKESITGSITSVNSDAIAIRPVSNAAAALEGSAAGIQVNNTSGQPGDGVSIRIRGFTTINGSNSPLIVVDGVPFGGNLSDINPSDIESISVLKDASASTLYGNRASNGVVMIQTKSGKGEGSMNLSVKQGFFNRGIAEYDRIGPNDFMETMWKGYRNALLTDRPTLTIAEANALASGNLFDESLKLNIYNVPNNQLYTADGKLNPNAQILPGYADDLNWYDGIERVGYRQEYNVNARNSNDKGGVYYSAGYLSENGYIKKSDFNRFTARMNADYRANDWLRYGLSIDGSHQKSSSLSATTGSSASFVNPFMYARNIAPIYPVHLHDPLTGEYVLDDEGNRRYDGGETTRGQYVGRHTVWENELNSQRSFRNTLHGQVFADFNFLNDFTFTIRGDLNVRNSENQSYNNAIIGDGAGNGGRASRSIYRYKNYTAQQILNWNRSFGDHNVEAIFGHENFYDNYNYLYGYKTTETFAGKEDLINFTEITNLYDYGVTYTTEGYFSRAKYNFKHKYFGEASFRRDGSSKFSKQKRWGNFWSVGGSWIISKEDFFNVESIDNLKFRASYGQVGSDMGAGNYAYHALYTIAQNSNLAALYKEQNGAEDLMWETSSSIGAALEGRAFDRLNFTIEYFDKRSDNLLFDINLPLSSGSTSTGSATSTITKNIGTISNSGLELTLDVDVIRNQDWRWKVGANATFMKNKIVRLPEENRENGLISGNYKRMEGRSIYDFYTYQFVGVDQMTGNALYEPDSETYNVNGSNPDAELIPAAFLTEINGQYYTTNTTYGKRDWSGSAIPKVYGSFNTEIGWNNFTLSGVFTYSLGGKTYDSSYSSLMAISGAPSALHADILKSWDGVPEGMTNTSPNRINPNGTPVVDFSRSSYNNATSDRFLQDGSYLVVKNINLNYKLSRQIVDRMSLKSMNFSLGVENLATFTKLKGMNPQQSFAGSSVNAFVTPRIFTFGVNVGL
ncbi:SusC/RagA family TonB-linked outer membrane protein [Gelidibacter pelagius]|uniref:SusC/RagA family TonB-linked outer membrane protein n=1 Tax=Gelidibacter pelagius TaxID=2819985 RepID=A0ABS3SW72_9FLAO|nr:SusC/RagA family TonB-linked outer membrane protein [Gelidibacter pelagius]MBO3099995.1 SusC/RagA family TonB-linked outer membrane protein [Gelidibacter pelagius]